MNSIGGADIVYVNDNTAVRLCLLRRRKLYLLDRNIVALVVDNYLVVDTARTGYSRNLEYISNSLNSYVRTNASRDSLLGNKRCLFKRRKKLLWTLAATITSRT